MPNYDAIVVGAGHNGLTSAGVLGKAGLKTLVLERNSYVGGMAATHELFPGYKHNVGAWALLVFRDEMLKTLELEKYGLELIRPRTSYCVFGENPEDKCFVAYTDKMEMAGHLMEHGPELLEGFTNLYTYFQKFKELINKEIYKTPDAIEKLIAEEPDPQTREILIKLNYGSALDVLRLFLPDPNKHRLIQGSLCASAIDGTHCGPYTAGTGFSMAYHYAMGDDYDFRTSRGGIGALSGALAKSATDNGAEIRTKAQVKRFLIEKGKVTGVELQSGEKINAKVVLSCLDARTTYLGMIGEEHLPTEVIHAIKEIKYENGYVQVHLCLDEPPEFTGHMAFANEDNIRALTAYIPSAEHLSNCWEQYKRGEVPDDPVSYCAVPSLVDPSLAPEGKYTCTIFSHYFPYDVPEAKRKEMRDLMADRIIDRINKHAPNFKASITNKAVLTHHWFQNTFGITGGDFAQGLIHPEQMWDKRPIRGWADYRTPVEGVYMCGSACHPGPGVTCIPGYNSAREVLKDWREEVIGD
jgi:phytoene dehydrogenase-like protein